MVYILVIVIVAVMVIATFGSFRLDAKKVVELEELRNAQHDLEWKVEELDGSYKLVNIKTNQYISYVFNVFADSAPIDHATVFHSELSARKALQKYLKRKMKGKIITY